jgi:hypothetical protein
MTGKTATFLAGSNEAISTLNNLSNINRVSTFEHEGHTMAYLTNARLASNVDFQASTFAVATNCQPISQACGLTALTGSSTPFNCTPGFTGDTTLFQEEPVCPQGPYAMTSITMFRDPDLNENITAQDRQTNPFYFGTWSDVITNSDTGPNSIAQDPNIIVPKDGGLAWVLRCSSTVYDLTYTYINSTFGVPSLRKSNETLAQIMATPFPMGFACSTLTNLAIISAISDSADELANKWSTGFSTTAVAMAAGIMSPHRNLQEQSRTSMLVARVPKAPLFTLIVLNLIYATIGIALAIYAATNQPTEARNVQARLSVAGLAAACFEAEDRIRAPVENVEELFKERTEGRHSSSKVGFAQTEVGGWRYISVGGKHVTYGRSFE